MDEDTILRELLKKLDQTHAASVNHTLQIELINEKLSNVNYQQELINELVEERRLRNEAERRKIEFWTDVKKHLLSGSALAFIIAVGTAAWFLLKEWLQRGSP